LTPGSTRVAIAIAGHQSVIKDLAASSVEFSATVQTRLDAVERQIAELREELCRRSELGRQRRKRARELGQQIAQPGLLYVPGLRVKIALHQWFDCCQAVGVSGRCPICCRYTPLRSIGLYCAVIQALALVG
jgi:hypothetical protein